ncbi:MAG TPA: BtpA/SgcQ family protein [Streptosporangiaceae bacterium]|nr:BtpA/SgcQ family protein [Streptosporangiaceae bacterium]
MTAERLAEALAVADGVIVGTSLKVDGITWNPVDPARARAVRGYRPRGAPACDRATLVQPGSAGRD